MSSQKRLTGLRRLEGGLRSRLALLREKLRHLLRARRVAEADLAGADDRQQANLALARQDFERGNREFGAARCRRIDRLAGRRTALAKYIEKAPASLEQVAGEIAAVRDELQEVTSVIVQEEVRLSLAALGIELPEFQEQAQSAAGPLSLIEIKLRGEALQAAEDRLAEAERALETRNEAAECRDAEQAATEAALRERQKEQDRRKERLSEKENTLGRKAREVAEEAVRAREQLEQTSRLRAELDHPEKQIAHLRNLAEKQPIEEKRRLLAEIEQHALKLAESSRELAVLRDRLKTAQEDAKTMDEARHSLQEEVARAEGPTRQTAEEVQELENKLVLAGVRREKLEAQVTELREAIAQEEATARELEAENTRLAEAHDLAAKTSERLRAEGKRVIESEASSRAKKLAAQMIEALEQDR